MRRNQKNEIRPKTGVKWSETDVKCLVSLYPSKNNQELAKEFGRPIWGIIGKARQLNLKKSYAMRPRSCSAWSTEEMNLLEELFQTTPNEEIAEIIGRSINSIAMKAGKMGLCKSEFWSEKEDKLLKGLYKKMPYDILAKKFKRNIGAVKARIFLLSLECKVENWTKVENDYLRRNHLKKSYQDIADYLERSYRSVAEKARRIGLAKKQSSVKKISHIKHAPCPV